MLFFTIDDDKTELKNLHRSILFAEPSAVVKSFDDPIALLETIKAQYLCPDVIFCDIQMQGMSGIELCKSLVKLLPRTNIIFVTAHKEYMEDAFKLHASGYLLKPVTPTSSRRTS